MDWVTGATRRGIRMLSAVFFLFAAAESNAVQRIELQLHKLEGTGWELAQPRASMTIGPRGYTVAAHSDYLKGRDGETWLRDLSVQCDKPEFNAEFILCRQGRVAFTVEATGERVASAADFVFRQSDGRFRASGVIVKGGGRLAWEVKRVLEGLSISLNSNGLPLGPWLPWLQGFYPKLAALSGSLSRLDADIHLRFNGTIRAGFHLEGDGLGFDTDNGRIAAAGLSAQIQGSMGQSDGGWRFDVRSTISAGQVLIGAFYTQIGPSAVDIIVEGALSGGKRLMLDKFAFTDPDAVRVTGSGTFSWDAKALIQRLSLNFERVRLPGFYRDYAQSLLGRFGFDNLETSGGLSGVVSLQKNELTALDLHFEAIDIRDARQRLGVNGLSGDARWRRRGELQVSEFGWKEARIYRIPLGSVTWHIGAAGGRFELLQETTLPVLDGALVIHRLEATKMLADDPRVLFDAGLRPVSMESLSQALGWPRMSGTLSGRIPALSLRRGVWRLGGELVVNVFDGVIRVSNLRLERPFGVLPKLEADVDVDSLSLERITSVFTIGKIRGRLGGHVLDLRLLNWLPVHFDALLATPPGDDSTHRISQRAVNSLSSLGGGGASAALSRTFLRIFDDFGYEKLGLRCLLDGNVCHMGGVAPAPNGGYYIVKGSGLPNVDVIGYVQWVDWPQLVDQLVEAIQGTPPTVGEADS